MIDAVEPLSLVLWGVFFLAAGMYPLGFMLGASCSPCCGGQCGDPPVEFNRCIRFVNTNTSAPQTTYAAGASVDMPLHGYSRAVTRPEQIGARRVPTSLEVSVGAYLDMFAATMSDGETRTATYRVYYFSPDNSSNMDLGTALQWNVTLQGVTRPLVMPASISSLQSVIYSSGAYSTPQVVEYGVGDARLSASATTSTTVHSVSVASGGQWLDGATVTESSLKAMLTASFIERNSTWVSQLTFNADVAAFQYVPFGSEVAISYVIKHSRGSQHRFATFAVTVLKGDPGSVTAIPSGGLQSVSISQQPYADTLYGVTPPVFSGSNVTIYSDNAQWDSGYQSVSIPFPAVVVNPTGVQLRATEFGTEVTNGQFLSMMGRNGYGRLAGKPLTFGWIMFAFDPGPTSGLTATTNTRNPWNYNTSAVESFLAGDTTTEYIDENNVTWTMQVSDPTQFCGVSLCPQYTNWVNGNVTEARSVGYPNTLSKTLTFTPTVKLPQTYSTTDEKGTTTYTNLCYGQDALQPMSLRLGGCTYSGDTKTCQSLFASHANNYGAETSLIKNIAARHFYCGDLLWVLENGPCRQSLTYTGTEWHSCGTYALGGDDGALWAGDWMCADVNGKHRRTPKFPNGKCPPLEVEVEVTNNIKLGNGYFEFSSAWRHTGTVSSGTYVVLLANESETSGFASPYGNCNYQTYRLQINSSGGWIPNEASTAWIGIYRSRDTWCAAWKPWQFDTFQNNAFANQGLYYNPWRTKSSGGTEGYQPAIGTDFDVTSYAELDPVQTSVSPQNSQVPKAGGDVTLQRCCPQRTETVTIPPYTGRFPREILLEATQDYSSVYTVLQVTRGATAYVTQSGYDGSECPFDVIWLSGSTAYGAYYLASEFPGRIFSSESCPIVGQVSHSEQPGCSWSVTASDNWIIASKSDDGLLKISIDSGVTAVFAQPVYYDFSERQARRANITVTSLGTTKSWTIIQLKP